LVASPSSPFACFKDAPSRWQPPSRFSVMPGRPCSTSGKAARSMRTCSERTPTRTANTQMMCTSVVCTPESGLQIFFAFLLYIF
jgi:hypothetical protein